MENRNAHSKTPPKGGEAAEQTDTSFVGTLTDTDIRAYVKQGFLISKNFDDGCIKQACYELRASNIYYHPVESDEKMTVDEEKGEILLRPNQVVVIITEESLDVPTDILGRVLTKGSLFSLGITAVNTYVDPGFMGRLGIVFQNQTTKYLKIPVREHIAKIEFSKLHAPVEKGYYGQHNYESELWPVKSELFVKREELKDKFQISNPIDEIGLLYGEELKKAYDAVLRLQRRLIVAELIFITLASVLIGIALHFGGVGDTPFSIAVSLVTGIISSITATILTDHFYKPSK